MILFAAIQPPPRIIKAACRLMKHVPGARWHTPEKLHITVAYFGEVSDTLAEELDEDLARRALPSFELMLDGVGHFGRSEPHQLHFKVASHPDLTRLHQRAKTVARILRIPMEKRDFRPHMTLAYLKPFPNLEKIAAWEQRHSQARFGPFLVDQIGLYSSHQTKRGPNRYDLEATYPLVG